MTNSNKDAHNGVRNNAAAGNKGDTKKSNPKPECGTINGKPRKFVRPGAIITTGAAKPNKTRKVESSEWYAEFRIPQDIIDTAKVRHITNDVARRGLGLRAPQAWDLSGINFPYFDPATSTVTYNRVRREQHGKKNDIDYGPKYLGNCAEDAVRILYCYPGAVPRLKDEHTSIVLVEAEKSVLALEAFARRTKRENLVFLAMGGAYGWKSKEHSILPGMNICTGRNVYVLLDANVSTNKQVREARLGLNAFLFSIGCKVMNATLPHDLEGVNGPDDVCKLPEGDQILSDVFDEAVAGIVAPYSQHALAERFAGENLDNCRYVPNVGWHLWDGHRWKFDEEGHVEMLAQELCSTAASERITTTEQNKLRSRATREAVLREAQPHLTASLEQFDSNIMLLNTVAGTVDLRTGELRPAQREDYITKMTAAAPSSEKPARWLKFIDEITMGDKSLGSFLQRVAGYCLTGNVEEHALFFLYGGGLNGKGTFTRTLQRILSEYAAVVANEMLMATHNEPHPTGIAALRGARMATASEVEDGSRWAEAKIKAITGGDPITARFMRKDFFTFMPQFKLVILGNHKPKLRNVGVSIQRRFNLVPFNMTFTEETKDKALDETLKSEYGGILQWYIDGCLAWQHEGLKPPAAVRDATEAYLTAQDVLAEFLEAYTCDDPNGKVLPGPLYASYKTWMDTRGEFVLSQTMFTPKLEERGYSKKKANSIRYITGLRWLTEKEISARATRESILDIRESLRAKKAATEALRKGASLEVVGGRDR